MNHSCSSASSKVRACSILHSSSTPQGVWVLPKSRGLWWVGVCAERDSLKKIQMLSPGKTNRCPLQLPPWNRIIHPLSTWLRTPVPKDGISTPPFTSCVTMAGSLHQSAWVSVSHLHKGSDGPHRQLESPWKHLAKSPSRLRLRQVALQFGVAWTISLACCPASSRAAVCGEQPDVAQRARLSWVQSLNLPP